MSDLEELNQLLNYFQISAEPEDKQKIPESHLEQAGIHLKETPNQNYNKNEKWKGKYNYLDREKETNDNLFRLPVSGGLVSRHDPGLVNDTHPHGHMGIDIGAELNSPVYAAAPGIVTRIYNEQDNPAGGNAITIKNNDSPKITTYYAHLNSVNVSVNEHVDQNTVIGFVGHSGGISNGKRRGISDHLHFQTIINGSNIDPLSIIGKPINVEAAIKSTLKKLS
jgi:murein DD-endopeptidase MepM/ murein hydrolase activator NlpD